MALNSDDPRALRRSTHTIDEAYGSKHSRSTRGMMFEDRCRRVVRNKAHFHGTLSSYNFPGCSAAEPPYKVQHQWTTTSRLLANPSSPTEPHPRLRNGHPNVQGVQLQRPNMLFAGTDCFGPHNIEKRIMVKKAVKRYCSNNLKNDYESEEINSQDSERLFINYVLCQKNATTTSKSAKNVTTTLSVKNATTTSN